MVRIRYKLYDKEKKLMHITDNFGVTARLNTEFNYEEKGKGYIMAHQCVAVEPP